jgi:MMPL family
LRARFAFFTRAGFWIGSVVVWVFQEGHLGALGTAATGALGVQLPVLLFCIAFGLSMDYEVFLFSRIREYWLASHRGWGPATDGGGARRRHARADAGGPGVHARAGSAQLVGARRLARLHDRFGVSEADN